MCKVLHILKWLCEAIRISYGRLGSVDSITSILIIVNILSQEDFLNLGLWYLRSYFLVAFRIKEENPNPVAIIT